MNKKVALIIMDGWGHGSNPEVSAIAQANTPFVDSLYKNYVNSELEASGLAVGLPEGQMGNSEVGHLNIGAGRVVPQELVRISDAIEDGLIVQNQAIKKICQDVIERNSKLHLVGLCSSGGVHSHVNHLLGLLDVAKAKGISDVCVHAITDGRDTNPKSGVQVLKQIEYYTKQIGLGRIATVSGRYYAMDRDKRWDRIHKAYEVLPPQNFTIFYRLVI